jgi:hypothetical protein
MLTALLLTLSAAAYLGCGGGGDNYAGGGIGGTGVTVSSVGTISAIGSVTVNGVAYETTGSEVLVGNTSMGSGDAALLQNLSVGMVVRVEGRLDAGAGAQADRVVYGSQLKGPVESITELDPRSKQLLILGQTVIADDRTVFQSAAAASIAAGMLVEVSGYLDESGRIAATYLAKLADAPAADQTVQVKGMVQALDTAARTFKINSLVVEYAAADLSRLPGGILQDGELVRISGTLQAKDALSAASIEPVEEFGSGAFDSVDLEGIITQVRSPSEFEVGRYTILIDAATDFTNLIPADLNRGTRIAVRGTLSGRSILADEISLPEKIRLESNVSAVNQFDKSLALSGLEDIAVLTTATTRIIGIAASLDQILPGDHIRIIGRRSANGELLAASLLVTPPNEAVKITGPVTSAAVPNLVILGATINTGTIPAPGFFGRDGKPISAEAFFQSVKPEDYVTAEGIQEVGGVVWSTVGFE